jgi:hypothetical protein
MADNKNLSHQLRWEWEQQLVLNIQFCRTCWQQNPFERTTRGELYASCNGLGFARVGEHSFHGFYEVTGTFV